MAEEVSVYFAPQNTEVSPKEPWVQMVPREEWGAREPTEKVPLNVYPVEKVRFTSTSTPLCTTKEECTPWVKKLQDIHMDKLSLPDIMYNFMICGDGTVFEGRGWRIDSWKPKEHEKLQGKCLDIAYMGEFKNDNPNWEQMTAGINLLKMGVEEKHIEHPYDTINMNDSKMDIAS